MKSSQHTMPGESTRTIWRRRPRTAVPGILLCAIVSVGAHANPIVFNDQALDQIPQARQICQGIIQVQPGEDRFNGCTSSLSDSVRHATTTRAVAAARDACFQELHRPRTDLNLCVLRAADAKVAPGNDMVQLPPNGFDAANGAPDDLDSSRSFYAVSNDTKFRRERRACAVIGLDPALGAFSHCVSDLQDALQTPATD
jgi:hypothetical protein